LCRSRLERAEVGRVLSQYLTQARRGHRHADDFDSTSPDLSPNSARIQGRHSVIINNITMAPRNDAKDGANGSDESKAEKGYATLATLRCGNIATLF
jgi:hypothetical protein